MFVIYASHVNNGETSTQQHQAPDEATENNPMDVIDSQVLQEHFEMVSESFIFLNSKRHLFHIYLRVFCDLFDLTG